MGPPENVYQDGSTALHFENNTANDPTVFLGFRILYRFYASTDKANTDRNTITTYYSSSPTTAYSRMINVLGYRELLFDDDPLLKIATMAERNDPFAFQISFDTRNTTGVWIDFAPSSATVDTNPTLPGLVTRDVGSASNDDFSDAELVPNDTDLVSGRYSTDSIPTTYLQCYVFTYGISTANGVEEVYSGPTWFSGSPESLLSFTVNVN